MQMNTQALPGCLIMAAGNASRFRANKLAAEFDGKPLIRHALEAVPKALFSRVVVVTQYPQVMELARDFGFEAIENPQERTYGSTSSGVACAKLSSVGKRAKSAGVTRFTRASVHCADRRTAIISS